MSLWSADFKNCNLSGLQSWSFSRSWTKRTSQRSRAWPVHHHLWQSFLALTKHWPLFDLMAGSIGIQTWRQHTASIVTSGHIDISSNTASRDCRHTWIRVNSIKIRYLKLMNGVQSMCGFMDRWLVDGSSDVPGWPHEPFSHQLHSSCEPTLGLHVCRHPATPWKGGRGEIEGIARKVWKLSEYYWSGKSHFVALEGWKSRLDGGQGHDVWCRLHEGTAGVQEGPQRFKSKFVYCNVNGKSSHALPISTCSWRFCTQPSN